MANGRVGDTAIRRMGDTANGRHGDTAMWKADFTAKRLQRIAQGFSPGFDAGKRALKVAPEGVD
jgi:hypothetical protein